MLGYLYIILSMKNSRKKSNLQITTFFFSKICLFLLIENLKKKMLCHVHLKVQTFALTNHSYGQIFQILRLLSVFIPFIYFILVTPKGNGW